MGIFITRCARIGGPAIKALGTVGFIFAEFGVGSGIHGDIIVGLLGEEETQCQVVVSSVFRVRPHGSFRWDASKKWLRYRHMKIGHRSPHGQKIMVFDPATNRSAPLVWQDTPIQGCPSGVNCQENPPSQGGFGATRGFPHTAAAQSALHRGCPGSRQPDPDPSSPAFNSQLLLVFGWTNREADTGPSERPLQLIVGEARLMHRQRGIQINDIPVEGMHHLQKQPVNHTSDRLVIWMQGHIQVIVAQRCRPPFRG